MHELPDMVVESPHAHFFTSRAQQRRGHFLEPYHGSDLFRKWQRRQLMAARFRCGEKPGEFRFQGVHCFHLFCQAVAQDKRSFTKRGVTARE